MINIFAFVLFLQKLIHQDLLIWNLEAFPKDGHFISTVKLIKTMAYAHR